MFANAKDVQADPIGELNLFEEMVHELHRAACLRKTGVINSLPFDVSDTTRTRRSSGLSTRLTKPLAKRRSTATLIDPGVRNTFGPIVFTGKGPLFRRASSMRKSVSSSPVS